MTNEEALQQAVENALFRVLHEAQYGRWRNASFHDMWMRKRAQSPNPLVRHGAKFFSQNDEDGILLEICRRTGLENGVFVELGVGDGLENNSLILLMHGWRGVWLGGVPLAFEVPDDGPLFFQKSWITLENCRALVEHGLGVLDAPRANVLSIDLDGNDLYVLEKLLEAGGEPDIVIAEYNGKFPPPVRWSIAYDPKHVWDETDYMGASLQSFVDLLEKFGYRLVACNVTGTNAFFVHQRHLARFADVPREVGALFVQAEYIVLSSGHVTSPRTIAGFLERAAGS
jgi:hypothetical protein